MPTRSVPRPRWLCVASGTSSRIRSTSPSAKPASSRRSVARPRTRPCAHGHALIPVASTPTTRRTAALPRRRDPDQRHHLLRREAGDRRAALERVARDDADLRPQRPLAADDVRARCARRAPRRAAPRRSRPPRSPPRRARGSATCGRPSAPGRGRRCSRSRPGRRSTPRWRKRIAFSMPRTPARESPIRTSGAEAWRSSCSRSPMAFATLADMAEIQLRAARLARVPRPAHAARDRERVRPDADAHGASSRSRSRATSR